MAQVSFLARLKKLEDNVDLIKKTFLHKMADMLVDLSPEDTGAYVESHRFSDNGNAAGRLSSENRIKAVPGESKEKARQLLHNQIDASSDEPRGVFNNRAPHANAVEYGGHNWSKEGYAVYTTVRREAGNILEQTILEVKGNLN